MHQSLLIIAWGRAVERAVLLLVIVAAAAGAQRAPAPPARGPGVLAGVVHDSLGQPLDRVNVSITPSGRSATTHADGAFRFDRLASGTYTLVARKFGFVPVIREIDLADSGAVVDVRLVALAAALPTVVTDPSGEFSIGLRAGRYMVRVQRPGFVSRLVSVTVPPDSGRRIVVGLRSGVEAGGHRAAAALEGLRVRLLMHEGPLGLFSHEDLLKAGDARIEQLAGFAVVHPVDSGCMAIIDGDPSNQMPVSTLDVKMLEFLEVYPKGPSEPRAFQRTRRTAASGGCPAIFAWLRR